MVDGHGGFETAAALLGWLWPIWSGSSAMGNLLRGLFGFLSFWVFFLGCPPKTVITCALCDYTCGCAPAPQRGVAAVTSAQADVVCEVDGQHQQVFNTLSPPAKIL